MSESNILRNILSYTEMAVLAASILIDGVARQVYPLIPIDAGSTLIELCIGEKTRFCLQFLKGSFDIYCFTSFGKFLLRLISPISTIMTNYSVFM